MIIYFDLVECIEDLTLLEDQSRSVEKRDNSTAGIAGFINASETHEICS